MVLLFGILITLSIIFFAIIFIIALVVVLSYNSLISKRNRVANAWAQIDVQLKRRYDLIPKLVDTVKGYMVYEKNLLTTITDLRSAIVSGSTQSKAAANNQLSQTFKTLFAVAENYPDLKAGKEFQELQHEIEVTEDKIAFVRTAYNDYVLDYNNALQMFPTNIFADMFHFQKADFFKTNEEEEQPVDVNFNDVNTNSGAKNNTINNNINYNKNSNINNDTNGNKTNNINNNTNNNIINQDASDTINTKNQMQQNFGSSSSSNKKKNNTSKSSSKKDNK
ncbi:MAG: LemA family protein [Candidatus Micrarchaeia archaeon]